MDHKDSQNLRLLLLGGFLITVLAIYLGLLYNTQVNDHAYYLAQSVRTIARQERVEASRGIITDRNGQLLISNRSTYNLTFDSSLLREGDEENASILRLVELCRDQGVPWSDNLPLTKEAPFSYTVSTLSDLQRGRFLTYLQDLAPARELLGAYLLQHPEAVPALAENPPPPTQVSETPEAAEKAAKSEGSRRVDLLTAQDLTSQLLQYSGLYATKLIDFMREDLSLPASFTMEEARLVLGIQYELSIRKLMNTTAYVLAEDVDTAMISLISDGAYAGAKITSSSVREYQTTSAAHILGYVSPIYKEDLEALEGKGYAGDDKIGRAGVEAAFEDYLRGTDGRRVVSTNSDGKITGEFWSEEPEPGNTVELTIDLELQQAVEAALAETISTMNAKDGNTTRGAGASVIKVGTGEVLALASYPTFSPVTYNQEYSTLAADPATPLLNRATQGAYAPGSTFKPLTAVAALAEGVITPYQKLQTKGHWVYPSDPNSYANCWLYNSNRGSHGRITVSQAITVSCNYFFAEMGYRLGMNTLNEYAKAFGLGVSTGIEIGDRAGNLVESRPGENQAPWAAFGQASYLFTPVQLSNYIATLVGDGRHCPVHLLKAVKSYDNAQVLAVGDSAPTNIVEVSDASLEAVKKGMYDLTTTGSLTSYFRNCVVSAGAKTGTAQINSSTANTGVFVCFAPYDKPEIALAIIIEEGGSGSALASTAVNILNAYFSAADIGTVIVGEQTLLP